MYEQEISRRTRYNRERQPLCIHSVEVLSYEIGRAYRMTSLHTLHQRKGRMISAGKLTDSQTFRGVYGY